MATQSERIGALENDVAEVKSGIGAILAALGGNSEPSGVSAVSDTPAPAQQKAAQKGKKLSRKDAAEVIPAGEGNGSTRKSADRNAPCTVSQARFAAETVHDNVALVHRQSTSGATAGVWYYAGVKREEFPPKIEAQYQQHLQNAVRELLSAFNLYAEPEDRLDVDSATYGDLWDWLDGNAPVSAQKAMQAQKAAEKAAAEK